MGGPASPLGNGLTRRITATYPEVEILSWSLQRDQADRVLNGEDLPPDALLRSLAATRGIDLEPFAMIVQAKAQAYEAIVAAGQKLRFGAEGLLSPALDTPAKLEAAVEALRVQALAFAQQLGVPAE